MMGVQGQISEVLNQVDKMESLCVDLQHQVWARHGAVPIGAQPELEVASTLFWCSVSFVTRVENTYLIR